MALAPGFYLLEKSQLGKTVARPRQTMSIIAFLRAVRRKEPLPQEVCVVGLERLLHHARDRREGARIISQALIGPQAGPHLRKQAPVVILPLEYLELGEHWKAGVRQRSEVEEIFAVAWVFPRVDMRSVDGADVCFSVL